MKRKLLHIIVWLLALLPVVDCAYSQLRKDTGVLHRIDEEITRLMKKGDIPGLSLVIIDSNQSFIRNYGYRDVAGKEPVTANTLFEIGSCTKAFTALAILQLIQQGKINPDADVKDYLPWFTSKYKDSAVHITVRRLLHHTSGIPWHTISLIPATNSKDALEKTVRQLRNVSLSELPGKQFEYATINYDVLALILEKVTGQSYENYVQQNVLQPLQLTATTVGIPVDSQQLATGYKTGFGKAQQYDAPVFRGNYAAGYVISNAHDMARWLQFQMGSIHHELYPLAQQSQVRDETVPPHGLASYGMGWNISLSGNGEIAHDGLNPNFSSYIAFRPRVQQGIVVLVNSNSHYTPVIGDHVMKLLTGETIKYQYDPGDGNDTMFSLITIVLLLYLLAMLVYLGIIITGAIGKQRTIVQVPRKKMTNYLVSLIFLLPVLYGIYLLPASMQLSWDTVKVWAPVSFWWMVVLLVAAIVLSYGVFFLAMLLPGTNPYTNEGPKIILVSILSGIANMVLILLITSSLKESIRLEYLSLYFVIALMVNILGRKYVQTSLIHITLGLVYTIRLELIHKIFSTSYQKFEQVDRGRVYATVNDDAGTVADSANMMVGLVTSLITATGAFLYLSTISLWTTILTLLFIVGIATLYTKVSKSTRIYFEEARDTRNVFMRLMNGMIDGFKEISLHRNKKLEYKQDMANSTAEFKDKTATAQIKFIKASLIGDTAFITLLGMVAFVAPKLFPDVERSTLSGFIIVMLYLAGPLTNIVNAIPAIMQLRISWNRIRAFLKDIPANMDLHKAPVVTNGPVVQSLKAEDIRFSYDNVNGGEGFSVGPFNLEVEKGQILFIIGGNGSGKTTLAKLLTGLYVPDAGTMYVNDKAVNSAQLSEYFSATFSPIYLFEKLYDTDVSGKTAAIKKYLDMLGLDNKVTIDQNKYSTVNLSGGQRKRLALLQCYLEDKPIYLFDEWAADQDPEYRRFFYRELLPAMKAQGKIVIAITHDDHYFEVADKIIKMDLGKVEYVPNNFKVDVLLSGL